MGKRTCGRWVRSTGHGCSVAEGPLDQSFHQREGMGVLQEQSTLPFGWDEPAWSHHYLELTLQLEGPLSSPFPQSRGLQLPGGGKVPPSALSHHSALVTSP